jgi:predicted amidohydrolase YtcJ
VNSATLALVNGTIRTMDPGKPTVEAVACEGGRILATGGRG